MMERLQREAGHCQRGPAAFLCHDKCLPSELEKTGPEGPAARQCAGR